MNQEKRNKKKKKRKKERKKEKKGRETRHRIAGMYIAPFGITEG